ncbi:MAG: CRTAC1 family protein [Planctomycetales bacterium]|nr:CRTAC1 family protein [Planctomycetales bacterium]
MLETRIVACRRLTILSTLCASVLLLGCEAAPPGSSASSPASASSDRERASEPGREPADEGKAPPFHFVDVSAEVGLSRVLWAGRPGKDHLLDSAGVGAAFLDYDRDGRLDIYVVNAWRLDGDAIVERGRNALYRGLSDGTFADVTTSAGVDGQGNWGSGICVADYDDDGWPDLLVTNFGPNILYRNNGDGTFTNVAAELGIETPGWNTGASFFDADGDGDLDLYIAGYIDCTLDDVLQAERTLDWKGMDKVAFGPFGLEGARDHFFVAQDGHFEDRTEDAGFEDKALGFGFAVRAGDLDGDGRADVYVANDSDANYLYKAAGDGKFREIGLWSGAAFSAKGAAQASMGLALGDVDQDGQDDLFVTHFAEDHSTFYRGLDGGFFEDATATVGLARATFQPMSWGTALADLDNDGDLDLVIANGHIYPQVDAHPETGMTFGQQNQVFENRGGKFWEQTSESGSGFALVQSSRGLAIGDYDNDGDLDLLLTCLDAPPVLLRNDSPCGAWLSITCAVEPGQGPVIGTRVSVVVDGHRLQRDIAAGDSFLSTHDSRLHFGLGTAEIVDRIEVHWPDGSVTVQSRVPTRQHLVIRKGKS